MLDPPLAEARGVLYTQLHRQVENICGLKRVEAQRYGRIQRHDRTYLSLVKDKEAYDITFAYEKVEEVLKAAAEFYRHWRQQLALWDLESAQVYEVVGDDVEKWTQLLNEIKDGRRTFDSSEDRKCFGAVSINYGNVKQDVSNKYDQWHKEILGKFGSKLKGQLGGLYKDIQGARRKLEGLSVDPTEDVTLFVTEIRAIERQDPRMGEMIERMKHGQRLLYSQRYQFPNDWLFTDVVEFEYTQSFK